MKTKLIKKIFSSAMISTMILTATPIIATNFDLNVSIVEAAKGGAKLNIPKSTPKVNLDKTPKTQNKNYADEHKSVSSGGKEYQPSKSAKDLQKNSTSTNRGSIFGNALKNIGLFAGGMMLGGLIGSLFGFGSGFFSEVLGFLFNLALIYAAYRGIKYFYGKFRGDQNKNSQPIDVTPPSAINYPNGSSLGMDYDRKRTADHYRKL
ncbi:MAG: hypothetical protein IJ728_02470 [Selenomonadaceae bacterium]|nr:hypothetical protein [Selenomonadaceae bacterium]